MNDSSWVGDPNLHQTSKNQTSEIIFYAKKLFQDRMAQFDAGPAVQPAEFDRVVDWIGLRVINLFMGE
jgi:hypothetical protein